MTDADRGAVQRRTLWVLGIAVALATAASAAAFSASAVLAEDITGSEGLAGIAAAGLTVGAALGAVPLARVMSRWGRRPGLGLGLWVAAGGGLIVAGAAAADLYPAVVIGTVTIGVGNAVALAARFAAADLAAPRARGRAIGVVIWAATVGAVLGPILATSIADPAATSLGAPEYVGTYLFSAAVLAAGAVVIGRSLRPDPLLLSRGMNGSPVIDGEGPAASGWSALRASAGATLATGGLVAAHVVMVGIMTVTPLHLSHGQNGLRIIGFVISVHILGMYAFSPVMGWLTDRLGAPVVIITGGVLLLTAAELAAATGPDERPQIFLALFLLGLGWSAELVAASSVIAVQVPLSGRVAAQGIADLLMNGFGAAAGIAAGFLLGSQGFDVLGHAGAVLAALVIVAGAASLRRPPSRDLRPATATVRP